MKILYLSLNPNLPGPFSKIDPLLIAALRSLGCQITKRTWGRHSEHESIIQKFIGRFGDIINALLVLIKSHQDILYVVTTLDEYALSRDIPLLLATYWFPVKKVLIEHGSKTAPLTLPGHRFYKFLTRLLIQLSDVILLLSTEELMSWADFEPNGRYYRVDNPFISKTMNSDNVANSGEKTNSCPTIIFAGRLLKEKGIFELLDAMPILLKQNDCHLLIAGEGEEKEEIKRQIEKANLSETVSLLGYVHQNQLSEIYRSSSVFILPTYREGFPNVIAEAMSFGLPIITTPVGGIPDHLQDGVNALFVQPRDPKAIADAVVRLLNDPKLCLEMSRANLAKIQEFKPEKVAARYVEIFEELLGSNSGI